MKSIAILLIMSFCLLACSEQKIPKANPYTRSEDVRVEIKLNKRPGAINFDISSTKSNYYSLPKNVTIHHYPEKPQDGEGSLASSFLNVGTEAQPLQTEPTLRIGCDGASETVLPATIKTEVLELCGPLSFKGGDLDIDAKTVILNGVDIRAEVTSERLGYFASDAISIVAINLVLDGENVISGFRESKMRQIKGSPQMIFFIGFLRGEGALRINALNELPPEGAVY